MSDRLSRRLPSFAFGCPNGQPDAHSPAEGPNHDQPASDPDFNRVTGWRVAGDHRDTGQDDSAAHHVEQDSSPRPSRPFEAEGLSRSAHDWNVRDGLASGSSPTRRPVHHDLAGEFVDHVLTLDAGGSSTPLTDLDSLLVSVETVAALESFLDGPRQRAVGRGNLKGDAPWFGPCEPSVLLEVLANPTSFLLRRAHELA